ncbi:HNH endonuclease signature motif containing protein [Nocardioides pinisoli]|uniref:HNH endonuclease n=1 Tax=Nocardioides pinisoli TaxID=2950279 RepID=A0ABT1KWA8_9ACTN|nr:HNH endonuclease signature motif containing protein [Nocardioides pinisoli]MCP3421298.1 HNH endonuclease [Nocardioides pinisoli]
MIEALAGPGAGEVEDLTARDLLAAIRDRRRDEERAAADQLLLAAQWADLHPPESIHDAAVFSMAAGGREHEEPIAGEGCPLVAEFCVAELGSVLGTSTTAAKKLIGHALELRHRLPRLWAQVHSGRVPAWRARLVAETTIHSTPALTREAVGFVDAQVAAVAGKVGPAQLDRLVAEAIKRFDLAEPDPTADPEDGWLHVDPRHASIDTQDVHYAGTMRMEAELGIADALDVDRALAHGAATLKALGSTESLNVRRAKALGDLARTQTALDLHTQGGTAAKTTDPSTGTGTAAKTTGTGTGTDSDSDGDTGTGSDTGTVPDGLPAAREVVLHAHFDANLDGLSTVFGPTGRMEEGQRLVLLDQIRSWCADSRTKVTIKPVIDLNAQLATEVYAVPDKLREQVILRDRTCVFPWCTRPARRADIDHVIPHDPDAVAEGREQPGPTATWNLACLCRFHHRLKTHSAWRYEMVAPGTFEWTSPHGYRYRRDHTGTSSIDPPPTRSVDPPDPPGIPRPRRR